MITKFKLFESNPHRFEIGDYVKIKYYDMFGRIKYKKQKYKLLNIKKEEYGKVYSLQNVDTSKIKKLVNIGKTLDKVSEIEKIEIEVKKYNI